MKDTAFKLTEADTIARLQGYCFAVIPTSAGIYVDDSGNRFHVYRGRQLGQWFDVTNALSPTQSTDFDQLFLGRMGLEYEPPTIPPIAIAA